MPQSPRMTLGMPARSSTSVAIGVRLPRGASSVRNRAIAIDSGVASRSAPNELTAVP